MLFLFDWIFWPIKLLLIRDFKRVAVILVVWSLPLAAGHFFWQTVETAQISPLLLIAIYYLYLYASTWSVYLTSLPRRWQEACEHLNLKTALERYPTVVRVDRGFFCINARGFSLQDFEDRRAELASYLRVYIREIKQSKRLGFIDIFYSKKDLRPRSRLIRAAHSESWCWATPVEAISNANCPNSFTSGLQDCRAVVRA